MKQIRISPGFTLVELTVTVSLAAILVGFGVPGVNTLIKNNRTTANVSGFLSALNFTRSEAIKRGTRVTICGSNADFTDCSQSDSWENGWLVFNDPPANDGVVTVTNGAEILQVFPKLAGAQTTLRIPNLALKKDHLSFHGDGIPHDKTAAGLASRTFVLCDDRKLSDDKVHARKIVVNRRGRPRAMVANQNAPGQTITDCTQPNA